MKNTLTTTQQIEALNNALRGAGINEKYFVSTKYSKKKSKPFYVAVRTGESNENPLTFGKSYNEMNEYILGIIDLKKGKFN